jgi:hypothetical protein
MVAWKMTGGGKLRGTIVDQARSSTPADDSEVSAGLAALLLKLALFENGAVPYADVVARGLEVPAPIWNPAHSLSGFTLLGRRLTRR